jgi:hypothetical protein
MIYPTEIEEVLHPSQDFKCPGVRSGRPGDVAVWIKLEEPLPRMRDPSILRKNSRSHLQVHEIRQRISHDASGKIQKFKMKELAIKNLGRNSRKAG